MENSASVVVDEFLEFPKIARLNREIVVTEKIDGTNAQVFVSADLSVVRAGSRTRWITLEDDNHGFARWVKEHEEELKGLGAGRHFGEWWGSGIQRSYGLKEKRWSLFNVAKWGESRPACCHVVPVIYRGLFSQAQIKIALDKLKANGSMASPGFNCPEGVVIFHTHGSHLYKVTLEKDDAGKGYGA